MATPRLRPGLPEDAPALLDVMTAASSGETAAGAMVHVYQDWALETAWLRYLLATGSGWVVEIDNRPCGFGITARRGAVHWLTSLYVAPEMQGRGLGRLLLEQLWPPASGSIRATLVDAASPRATGLYLRAGLMPRIPVLAFEGRLQSEDDQARGIATADDWSEVAGRVAEADAAAFGAARPADHAQWSEMGLAFRSLRDASGDWIGYGRWSSTGRLGPVVLTDGADWRAALVALAAEAAPGGIDSLRLMVPAVNEGALRACLALGLRTQGMEIALSTHPLRGWDRCLIHRAALP